MYLPQITTLKYGIYEPREVEYPKKKLVRKCTRSFMGFQTPSVYNSHIINGPMNKLFQLLSGNRKLHIHVNIILYILRIVLLTRETNLSFIC